MILPGRIKKVLDNITNSRVSTGYQIINDPNLDELGEKYGNVWKNGNIPQKQLKVVQNQLTKVKEISHFQILIDNIKKTGIMNPSVLETGCSSGYYSEVFQEANLDAQYEGCDYSSEFIKLARRLYPQIKFEIEDATSLSYQDNNFDIVISGCCILHIIDYQNAIKESVRVAKSFVIFHRTPVIHLNKTTFTKKIGYGVEMLEIFFNEEELINLFVGNNLSIIDVKTHGKFSIQGFDEPVFVKNYLCSKTGALRVSGQG